jgi:hypothetical protein
VLRVVVLLRRKGGLVRAQARIESARARDLVGLAILAGAIVYALRVERATTWFLAATGVAIVAQLLGFYLRTAARKQVAASGELPSGVGREDEPEDEACATCGNPSLIELVDAPRLLTGLNQLTPVSAAVCPACGALTGQVEDASRIPVGPQHGTALRRVAGGDDQEALEEPAEHDG